MADPNPRPSAQRQTDALIEQFMSSQAGRVGHRQLRDAGVSAKAIRSRRRSGRLIDVTDGPRPGSKPEVKRETNQRRTTRVYAATAAPTTVDATWWTSWLASPPPSAISRLTACSVLGARRHGGPIHVVHLGGTWQAPRGVRAHRTSSLPEEDLISVDGLPCTRLGRSLVDAAGDTGRDSLSEATLDEIVDTSIKLQIYDEKDMRRAIAAGPSEPGAIRLDAALNRLDVRTGEFRSEFERRLTRLVQTSKLIPAPVVNVLVHGYRPDLWWLRTRAIVECDGRDYHRSMAEIIRDGEREAILRQRGFVLLAIRWHQLKYEEAATLERIERFVLANLEAPQPLSI